MSGATSPLLCRAT